MRLLLVSLDKEKISLMFDLLSSPLAIKIASFKSPHTSDLSQKDKNHESQQQKPAIYAPERLASYLAS